MSDVDKIQSVIDRASKGEFDSIGKLLEELDKTSVSSEIESGRRTSKAVRRAEWKAALDVIPMDKIIQLEKTMSSYVDKFLLTRIELSEPRELTQSEIDGLAKEYLAWEELNDFIQARYSQFRAMVFASITARREREIQESGLISDRPASQMPGELYSEAYGIRFKREGGNRKPPQVVWSRLEAELPTEVYKEICDEVKVSRQVIPAHTEYRPNGEKLMDAVQKGLVPLEVLREAIIPGAWMTPKFVPRKA